MSRKRIIPFAIMIFVTLLWGLSFLSIKVAIRALAPMTLALSRFVIASLILFILLKIREPESKLERKDIPLMAISAVFGITIYFFFENNGVKMTTASTASIIIATIPILTIISDYLFCGNKITLPKAIGVGLSFLGVYLIVSGNGQQDISSGDFIGNLLMLGAALAWVIYSLLTRPLGQRYSRLAITTYQNIIGTLTIIPFVFFETNNWYMVNSTVIGNVIFLGVFCSAVGYYGYVYAIGELGVGVSSLLINLIPVVTVISSFFILGEKITTMQMIGGGIVIFAVYLAEINNWLKINFWRQSAKSKQINN